MALCLHDDVMNNPEFESAQSVGSDSMRSSIGRVLDLLCFAGWVLLTGSRRSVTDALSPVLQRYTSRRIVMMRSEACAHQ
jgi:hypothetical protein